MESLRVSKHRSVEPDLFDTLAPVGVVGEADGYLRSPRGATTFGFGSAAFSVRVVERPLANAIVAENHYSRRTYSGSTVHLGVFQGRDLVGILQFGFAMNPASAGSVVAGTGMHEYLELNRMWLDDAAPRNSESKAIAYAVRLIRRIRPAVKWIQSFADERCGLFGTVYQAAGFTYHGEHKGIFWEIDGDWFHNSLVTNSRTKSMPRSRFALANLHRATRHELRQFRYLKFLQQRFARGCRYPVLPYPKPSYAAGPVDERPSRPCEQGVTPCGRSTTET